MSTQAVFVATVAVCLLNGLVSPMRPLLWYLHPVWLPEMLPATREVVVYGASLILSTATLLGAAVPAAVAERLGLPPATAMWVWFGAAMLLLVAGLR